MSEILKVEWGTTVLPCGHEVLDPDQSHYCTYLSLRSLERHMEPCAVAGPARTVMHADEQQFITVHLQCELAFAQMQFDLRRAIAAVRSSAYPDAVAALDRIKVWTKLLSRLLGVFHTMHPDDFNAFVLALKPASGAESVNVRKVELLSGLKPDSPFVRFGAHILTYRQTLDRDPEPGDGKPKARWWTEELTQLAREDSLYEVFMATLAHAGLSVAALYERDGTDSQLRRLADSLYGYELAFLAFRRMHVQIARHQLGIRKGTGHTDGVPFLRAIYETARFFPQLTAYKEQKKKEQTAGEGGW